MALSVSGKLSELSCKNILNFDKMLIIGSRFLKTLRKPVTISALILSVSPRKNPSRPLVVCCNGTVVTPQFRSYTPFSGSGSCPENAFAALQRTQGTILFTPFWLIFFTPGYIICVHTGYTDSAKRFFPGWSGPLINDFRQQKDLKRMKLWYTEFVKGFTL